MPNKSGVKQSGAKESAANESAANLHPPNLYQKGKEAYISIYLCRIAVH